MSNIPERYQPLSACRPPPTPPPAPSSPPGIADVDLMLVNRPVQGEATSEEETHAVSRGRRESQGDGELAQEEIDLLQTCGETIRAVTSQ